MGDYIDRRKLLSTIHEEYGKQRAYRAIKDAPAEDVVRVVRCKDCGNYNTAACSTGTGWCEIRNCGETDDNFCNYGVRKES